MAEQEFPAELIEAQRAYWAAERRAEEIAARMPSGMDVISGAAIVSEEDRRELEEVRAERGRLLDTLYGHPFFEGVDRPEDLREQLRRAAREA